MAQTVKDRNMAPAFLCSSQATTVCASSVAQQWQKALHEPSKITHQLLCTALRHRPPLHVVKSLLRLNENAAVCPPGEPMSALHTALQSSCEVPIVSCLLQAWPSALVRKSPCGKNKVPMDPLTYAKLYRYGESQLIELLSRPMKYWLGKTALEKHLSKQESLFVLKRDSSFDSSYSVVMGQRGKQLQARDDSEEEEEDCDGGSEDNDSSASSDILGCLSMPRLNQNRLGAEPMGLEESKQQYKKKKQVKFRPDPQLSNQEDMVNIKTICMAVLRGHRRLAAQLKKLEEQEKADDATETPTEDILEAWGEELLLTMQNQTKQQLNEFSRSLETKTQQRYDSFERKVKQVFGQQRTDVDGRLNSIHRQLGQMENMMSAWKTQKDLAAREVAATMTSWTSTYRTFPDMISKPPSSVQLTASDDDDVRSLLTDTTPNRRKVAPNPRDKRNLVAQLRLLICQV